MRSVAIAHPSPQAPKLEDLAGFFNQFFRNLPFGIAALHLSDPDDVSTWRVLATNSTAERVGGRTARALVHLRLSNRVYGERSVNLEQVYRLALLRGRARSVGFLNYTYAMGAREVFSLRVCPLIGNTLGLVFQDVTGAQEATRKLKEKDWQFNQVCISVAAIIWRADSVTLQFTYVSPQAHEILGFWPERWLHESSFFRNRVHPDDWPLVQSACAEAVASENRGCFDCRIYNMRGEIRWFRVFVQRGHHLAGRIELEGAMVDITDQKQAALSARDITLAVMRAQERERKALSINLHDSIGQSLTSLTFTLGRLQRDPALSKDVREELGECIKTVQACSNEIRSVSTMLHPPLLELMGLGPALRSYAKKFSAQSGIRVVVDASKSATDLPSEHQIALFRAAQECLTNIQRHSGAKSAQIRLFCNAAEVFLEIEDHGNGVHSDLIEKMEAGTGGPGIGILKMRERIRELRGDLKFSSIGKGTLLCIRIPRPPVLKHQEKQQDD